MQAEMFSLLEQLTGRLQSLTEGINGDLGKTQEKLMNKYIKDPGSEDVIRMRNSLRLFIEEASPVLRFGVFPPPLNSQASLELKAKPKHQEQLHTAYGQGMQLIESAGDHLEAFAKTLDEPALTMAPWTCVRAVLEASAVSAWLLDPMIDPDTRLGRSLGRRLQGLVEMKKFGAISNAEILGHAEKRIEEAKQIAAKLGISAITMPGSTEIIKRMLDDEGAFRALSAVAHGHQWALHQFGFVLGQEIPDVAFQRKWHKPPWVLRNSLPRFQW